MTIMEPVVVSPGFKINAYPQGKKQTHHFKLLPLLSAMLLWFIVENVIAFSPIHPFLDRVLINPVPQKFMELESSRNKPLDVLALGTSRTWNGFNALAFEKSFPTSIHAFNMGVPQVGYDWMMVYLKEHIRRFGKPKVLVLEATDFLFNRANVTNGLYYQNLTAWNPLILQDVLLNPLFSASDKQNVILSLISVFYRYREVLSPVTLTKMMIKGPTSESEDMNHMIKGWEPLSRSQIGGMPTGKIWVREKDYLPVDTREFRALIDYCRQIRLPVMLIEWPDEIRYKTLSDHSALARAYKATLQQLIHEYKLPYLDMNRQPQASAPADFVDTRHLKPAAATRYTKFLSRKMMTLPEIASALQLSSTPLIVKK